MKKVKETQELIVAVFSTKAKADKFFEKYEAPKKFHGFSVINCRLEHDVSAINPESKETHSEIVMTVNKE